MGSLLLLLISTQVVITGEAPLSLGEQRAYQAALDAALASAIERVGVHVEHRFSAEQSEKGERSETHVHDLVRTRALGRVARHRVLDTERRDGRMHVRIVAEVIGPEAGSDLARHLPSVAMHIEGDEESIAALTAALTNRGIRIDPRAKALLRGSMKIDTLGKAGAELAKLEGWEKIELAVDLDLSSGDRTESRVSFRSSSIGTTVANAKKRLLSGRGKNAIDSILEKLAGDLRAKMPLEAPAERR